MRETQIATWCIARTLRSMGQFEDALTMQQALLHELDSTGEADGYVVEEIAECLTALDRSDEARPFFAQAYQHLVTDLWLAEQAPAWLARLKSLGGLE